MNGFEGEPTRSARRRGPGRLRRGEIASVGELVARALRAQPEDAKLFRVMASWERELPSRLVDNARPTSLRQGVLHVRASTSAWAQEVSLRSGEILRVLRAKLPSIPIGSIRVRTGRLPERLVPLRAGVRLVEPLTELPSEIATALERIGDDRLRRVLEAAVRTSLGRVVELSPENELRARGFVDAR